jgi:biotin carboxylase
MSDRPVTILCLASYYKGARFLEAAHALGCRVILVTREKLHNEPWPWDSIDRVFYMPRLSTQPDITYAVSYLARQEFIDRIVPLDDYDVLTAAALREHLRLPGLGQSTARLYRDKLAMRVRAQQAGIAVPPFSPIFHHHSLYEFTQRVPGPWVLKPRMEAGAMGIKQVHHEPEIWPLLEQLGDEQSAFLLEKFVPGRVYHVDGLVWDGEVILEVPSKYARPPMRVAHEGGVFVTYTLSPEDEEAQEILQLNQELMAVLGMDYGAYHSEFIRGDDGTLYFLETAARVGGASIDVLVEAASGLNPWAEWAAIEAALTHGETYELPKPKADFAGLLVCLARQQWPDLSGYRDPEIYYYMRKENHAGLILSAADFDRVQQLLGEYTGRFAHDFLAVAPPLDKAPE